MGECVYLESDLENIIHGFCCAESELNQCKCLPSLPYCRSSECLAHRDCFPGLYKCTIPIKSSRFSSHLCKSPEYPWDVSPVTEQCEISHPLPFLPKQYYLKPSKWVLAPCLWQRVSKMCSAPENSCILHQRLLQEFPSWHWLISDIWEMCFSCWTHSTLFDNYY